MAIPKPNWTTLNGAVDVKTPVQQQLPPSPSPPPPPQPLQQHNGAALAPLASVEDVTDSLAPVAAAAAAAPGSSNSRSPSRDNPLLIRFRQWTDRFGMNPLRPSSAEPPGGSGNSVGDGPKSPKLGSSRKVSHSLSRLFSRSCSRGGGERGGVQSAASPEPNQRPSSTCGSSRPSRATEISRKMSTSLENVPALPDSTNHPPKNA